MTNLKLIVFICAFSSGLFSTVKAQKELSGEVTYNFIVANPDGTTFTNPYTLYFDPHKSLYTKSGEIRQLKISDENESEFDAGQQAKTTIIKSNNPEPYYYINTENRILIFRETVANKLFIVKESFTTIDWVLQKETKKIGKYNCQKAIADYKGRQWTVWFTTEIPVTRGPWKLRGLPGLILEATENRDKFSFYAETVNLNPDDLLIQEKLKEPIIDNLSTNESYVGALKSKYDDISAMIQASSPRGTRSIEHCEICPDPKNLSLEVYE
ncbi:GLPGLI family protein [Aquimarina sp. W85]|uniref:GLPGLI family protein n=1 Tax=Aquimarina rhodophyticola TaxID=3342246 RepID=UPI00366B3255